MDFIKKLQSRRLLKDHTKMQESFSNKGIYCGFDPTASSLHLGHLSALNCLAYASVLGYSPIAIIGTSTALIGDPSGKSESRPLIESSVVLSNALSLTGQIFQVVQNLQKKLDRAGSICRPLQIVQNHEFYQNLGLIQFLREFGYFFPMNPLISRDFINQRQDGVTYTEFSYGLLQAFDFFKLFTEYDCAGQFGGSDQWSNITSGTELIRKKLGKASFGCTLPLLTTKDGKKFGKTEGNALFLSAQLTTAHDIYQYCFNQPDDLIEELMLRLTFISEEEIKDLLSLPLESRAPQKRLGLEVLEVLHGKEVAENTQRVSELVFSEKYSQIENKDLETLSGFAGRVEVTQTMMQSPFFTFLKEAKIVQSNKEAKNLLKTRAVKFNGQVLTEDSQLTHCGWVRDQFGVLTVGKKQIFLLLKPESP